MMLRDHTDTPAEEIAYQASALVVTVAALIGLVVAGLAHGRADHGIAAPEPSLQMTNTLPEYADSRFNLMFGRPEMALP